MFIKVYCFNIDNSISKTKILIYEDNKLILENIIFYKDIIFLPKNKVYKLKAISNNGRNIIKTSFITNDNLKRINLIFNKSSLITIKVLDKYYKESIIKKGEINLWQNTI